ncbi:MAG: 5'/3'-nucleotidase SurE [Acidimicrobiia bacterium]
MRILVTNDDGVEAPGIRALAIALAARGDELLVVAPDRDRSGASASIGPLHRLDALPVAEHHWPELPDVRVCAVAAPPATAVFVACVGGFGDPPDLIASGVNPGLNVGHLVLHSGTVCAALTGAGLGVPGLAVSLATGPDELRYATAAEVAAACVDPLVTLRSPGSHAPVLSLNVPNVALAELRGVREARLAAYGEAWVVSAEQVGTDLRLEFRGQKREPEPGTDRAVVRDGYASVTALTGIGSLDAGAVGVATDLESRLRG